MFAAAIVLLPGFGQGIRKLAAKLWLWFHPESTRAAEYGILRNSALRWEGGECPVCGTRKA